MYDGETPLTRAQALAARPIGDLTSLEGRTAVVTGAARGIGLAIALRLAEAGAQVVLGDSDEPALREAISAADEALRDRLCAFPVDVSVSSQVAALAECAVKRSGRLDIWINNAGIFPPTGPIAEADDAVLARTITINLGGAFAGAREAALRMPGGGVIINMTSAYGLRGQARMSAYSCSKHALIGLTRSLAIELGPQNVRVLGIAPGFVLTPGVEDYLAQLRAAGTQLQRQPDGIPLGRPCLPDDIARVVLFAVSDLAAMMTGAILPVDGGSLA